MKRIICFILTINLFSCSLQKLTSQNSDETKALIQAVIDDFNENQYVVSDTIKLFKTSDKKAPVSEWFVKNHLGVARTIDVKSEEELIDYFYAFSDEDILKFRSQLDNNRDTKWTDIGVEMKESSNPNVRISKPAFIRDYALIFVEYNSSGNIRIYKRVNNEWKIEALASVYISD